MAETKPAFKSEAKMITDALFESGALHSKITRDDMNMTEEFIADSMSHRFDMQIKSKALLDSIQKSKS